MYRQDEFFARRGREDGMDTVWWPPERPSVLHSSHTDTEDVWRFVQHIGFHILLQLGAVEKELQFCWNFTADPGKQQR